MRILFVASELERNWQGGIGRVVAGLAVSLAGQGHQLHIAGRARGAPGALSGVELHAWTPRRAKWTQLAPLHTLYRELDPDVVHFHSALPHGAVILPVLLARGRARRPVVALTPYTGARAEYRKRLTREALRYADLVITHSVWGAERARLAGARDAHTVVIPAGVDLPGRDSGMSRQPAILSLARLVRSKGIDVLLDAFARAAAHHPNWVLRIAGDGRDAAALRARSAALPCADRIEWLGHIEGEAKRTALARAAIGVAPSRDDNYPGALLQLQAHGLACVGSAVGGIPDILDGGESGVLVPPEDAAALGDALAGLMADRDRREALAAAGRRSAASRSFAAVAKAHAEAYARALDRRLR